MPSDDGLHTSFSKEFQLYSQPFHLFISWFGFLGTTIYSSVGTKEVKSIQTESSKRVWYNLHIEPSTPGKSMSLLFGYEFLPQAKVFPRPPIGTRGKNVMWENVIVSKIRNYWNDKIICRIGVIVSVPLTEHFYKFIYHHSIQVFHLLHTSWQLLVVIMARRISSPDNKIYRVLQIVLDPSESSVD